MAPSLPRLLGKVQLVFCRPDLEARTALRAPYAKSRFSFSNNALRLISQPVNRVQTTSRVWARGPMIGSKLFSSNELLSSNPVATFAAILR